MSTERIKLALVDDHPAIVSGIRAELRDYQDIELVGYVTQGKDLFSKVNLDKVDLVLVDLIMPGMNGIEVAGRLRKEQPQIKIIVVSGHLEPQNLEQLVKLNVDGYVFKGNTQPDNLVKAIRKVAWGGNYYDPDVVEMLYMRSSELEDYHEIRFTAKDREMAPYLHKKTPYNKIAEELKLSYKTVEWRAGKLRQLTLSENNDELAEFLQKNKQLWHPDYVVTK